MQAYENGLRHADTRLIKPDSEFFRFFSDPAGKDQACRGAKQRAETIGR